MGVPSKGSVQGSAEPRTPEEIADYAELRALIRPTQSVEILDRFALWLFGATAIVGTLGAGFSIDGTSHLNGAARVVFGGAIVFLTVALVLALLARLPLPVQVNRYSLEDLQRAHRKVVRLRFRLVLGAGLLFAAALLLAGLTSVV